MSGNRNTRLTLAGQMLLIVGVAFAVASAAGVGGADTAGSPDTNTRAVINPGVTCPNGTTPTAPCATASNGDVAPATESGAAEGTPLSIHVDGQAGTFFGVNAARMCKSGLNVRVSSTMSPSTGNCVGKPFVGSDFQDQNRQDDGFLQVSAAPQNTSVDFAFRVGSGTVNWSDTGGAHSITCDSSNPCALWLWESVDTSITPDGSGNIFKHYDIDYSGAVATTTSTAPVGSTTTSTTPSGPTTTSTAPSGSTTTSTTPSGSTTTSTTPSGSTTSTTVSGTTSTTAHGSTTSTTLGSTTTSTSHPATTSSTVHSTSTTVATPSSSTIVLNAPTTTAPAATTSTTSAGGGLSVSPASAAPGGSVTINSSGWIPCGATSTTSTTACPAVTVTIESAPITIGTLTPDATGTVSGPVTIPSSLPPGAHTIVLTGTGANGQPLTQQVPFTVAAASGAGSDSAAPASGSSGSGTSPGSLAATGGRFHLFWVGLCLAAIGSGLILVGRRHAALPT